MTSNNKSPAITTRRTQLSMIPVYLRSGEADSSSARRASLPNASRKQPCESHNATPKRVSHDLRGSPSINQRSPCLNRPASASLSVELPTQNEPPTPNGSKQFQKNFAGKPDPRRILSNLERLAQPESNVYQLLDIHQLLAIHERDAEDIAEREDRIKGRWQVDESKGAVFGLPLREAAKCASTSALFNGHELHLPLVVFDCVEELYRTGIYQQDLFRVLPNHQRLAELIHIFNSPNPHLNYRSKNRRSKVAEYNTTLLHPESTQDICALLINYLCSLPEPVLSTYLFDAIWEWGGVYGDTEDNDLEVGGDAASFIKENQHRPDFNFSLSKSRPEEPSSEATRISIVQHLLCLLPSPNFSLLVYLLAFFSHVVMMRDVNGVDIQELGRLFGKCVFGGESASSRSSPSRDYGSAMKERKNGQTMMGWFLRRWGPISSGLFDVVSVRPEKGRPPVIMEGRVKPKSPIDLNSRPSPSAWLSAKKRNKDVEWSMTLLSPKALSSFTATLWSPTFHHVSSPKSPSYFAAERGNDKEILSGPGIVRKNDHVEEPGTEVTRKPSATTPVEKRLTLTRMSTLTSINSSTDIDERLLDVSFIDDLNVLDTILSEDAAPAPRSATGNRTPNVPSKPVPNVYLELSQAHDRIRELESQLDRNDAMVGEALEMMFRAKRRVDEIDDLLKELEVALGIDVSSGRSQSGRLGLGLRLAGGDDETAKDVCGEHRKAYDIVVELRRLMLGEL